VASIAECFYGSEGQPCEPGYPHIWDSRRTVALFRETSAAHEWVAEGAQRVRFGISAAAWPDWGTTRAFAQMAEELGFDALVLPEHPMTIGNASWTTLAALAHATRAIRLGTLVTCACYWNPVMLARIVADVDRISGGRAILGIGSGDQPAEFRKLGLDWPPVHVRQAALEDALNIIRPLLIGQHVTYHGEFFEADNAILLPAPIQQPYVPIVVGGGGERTTLRFAAQYADASNLGAASWAGHVFTPEDARRKFEVLRGYCEASGRPYDRILRTALVGLLLGGSPRALETKRQQVAPVLRFLERLPIVGTPEQVVPRVRALLDAGFQYVFFHVFDLESLQLLAEQVIPALSA
jgi:alkanesulfonate monooxygenase SsuD/methylene tetrahydromethanopterin reductase-like flavin-dependent oxidoreductase (luciferase family)